MENMNYNRQTFDISSIFIKLLDFLYEIIYLI